MQLRKAGLRLLLPTDSRLSKTLIECELLRWSNNAASQLTGRLVSSLRMAVSVNLVLTMNCSRYEGIIMIMFNCRRFSRTHDDSPYYSLARRYLPTTRFYHVFMYWTTTFFHRWRHVKLKHGNLDKNRFLHTTPSLIMVSWEEVCQGSQDWYDSSNIPWFIQSWPQGTSTPLQRA